MLVRARSIASRQLAGIVVVGALLGGMTACETDEGASPTTPTETTTSGPASYDSVRALAQGLNSAGVRCDVFNVRSANVWEEASCQLRPSGTLYLYVRTNGTSPTLHHRSTGVVGANWLVQTADDPALARRIQELIGGHVEIGNS
jgi:hypothetical protein